MKLAACGHSAGAGSEHHASVGRKSVGYGGQAICDNPLPVITFIKAVQEQHGVTGCDCLLKDPPEWLPLSLRRFRSGRPDQERQSDVGSSSGKILGDLGEVDKHWNRCSRVGRPASSKLL